MPNMRRLDFFIEPQQFLVLKAVSDATGRSVADLIREAIAQWIENNQAQINDAQAVREHHLGV